MLHRQRRAGGERRDRRPPGPDAGRIEQYGRIIFARINLDSRVVHIDYNADRVRRMKEKYGPYVKVETASPEAVYFLSSLASARSRFGDMIREFEIETLDAYLDRAERAAPQSAGQTLTEQTNHQAPGLAAGFITRRRTTMKRESQSSEARPQNSRREFLKWSGTAAAGTALAGVAIPNVHAAEDNTIRLALIGCGGRGSGAVVNAFEATGGPVKLVVMADLFENRLTASHQGPEQADLRQGGRAARTGGSSASTPIARRSTASSRATWPC